MFSLSVSHYIVSFIGFSLDGCTMYFVIHTYLFVAFPLIEAAPDKICDFCGREE